MRVREILANRPFDPVTVSPDADIRDAAVVMTENAVSAVLVQLEDGVLTGILTERDVSRHFATTAVGTKSPVSAAMTGDVFTCSMDHEVSEIVAIMSDSNIRHIPVIEKGQAIGILSIRDIVRDHVSALESENRTLRNLVAALD